MNSTRREYHNEGIHQPIRAGQKEGAAKTGRDGEPYIGSLSSHLSQRIIKGSVFGREDEKYSVDFATIQRPDQGTRGECITYYSSRRQSAKREGCNNIYREHRIEYT
jgi:hypothetical protein